MGQRGPGKNEMRDRVVAGIRAGEIGLSEAADLAAVTPRRVRQWCEAENIDVVAARKAYLGRWLKRGENGGKVRRKPSKSQMRRQADRAVASWDSRRKR